MDINDKIIEVRNRIQALTKHFPYSKYEIDILTICYLAIASIDNDITDILDEVFSKIFILFNNGQFSKILKKVEGKEILKYGGMHITSKANDNCEYIVVNICNIPNNKYFTTVLFDITIHELKHAMNSQIKTHVMEEFTGEHIYSGLNGRPNGSYVFDEAFNCYVTRIYLQQIAYLKEIVTIKDCRIKQILRDFYTNFYKMQYSYRATYLLENLFLDEKVFNLLYNATLYRDLDTLYEELGKITNLSKSNVKWLFNECLGEYDIENYIMPCLREKLDLINENCPRRVLEIKPHFENI